MADDLSGFTGPTEILAARFRNRPDAESAGARIEALGYDPRELSCIGDHAGKAAAEGIAGGAVLGVALSAGAAIVGFGSLALLGPIGLVTGAIIGGVSDFMLGLGLSPDRALACENAVHTGSLVMTIQAHAGDSGAVRSILGEHIIASKNDASFQTSPPTRDGATA